MKPRNGTNDDFAGKPQEGEAILYSRAHPGDEVPWEFSANRREYGAQMRHRVAEELRQMELQAQSEAEAAAVHADAESRAAQDEAAAAEVRLAAGRKMMPLDRGVPLAAGWEVEEQVEHMRRSALREAAQQARRAAAERLEAARRAEAAALADSIARREEREIAEAQATILRQAAKYAEAEMRSKRKRYLQPQISLPKEPRSDPNRPEVFTRGEAVPSRRAGAVMEPRQTLAGREALLPKTCLTDDLNEPAGQVTARRGAPEAVNWSRAPIARLAAAASERTREIPMGTASSGPSDAASGTRESEAREEVYETVGPISETASDQACWFEAESLIGCGYSKLEAAPMIASSQRRAYSAAAHTAQPSRVPRQPGLTRWSALKEVLKQAERDRRYGRVRDLTNLRARDGTPDWQDAAHSTSRKTQFVAFYSQAGGTGKTSLVANLGSALAALGERVVLAEITGQRLLPLYFGAGGLRASLATSFRPPEACADAPVDLMSCDPAGRETGPGRSGRDVHSEVFQELIARARRADRVLIDLSANCGWMVARMAWMNPTIVVPLAPDLNSVAGLEAVERRFNVMQDAEGRPLQPVYLLNHFDESSALDRDVREALQQELGERLLPFAVRRSGRVKEALAQGMTIVDLNPESDVAKDYFGAAEWLRNGPAPAGRFE